MVVLKRKQIVGLSLIVLVAAAGFIQWVYAPGVKDDVKSQAASASTVKSAEENVILYDQNDAQQKNEDNSKTGEAQYVDKSTSTQLQSADKKATTDTKSDNDTKAVANQNVTQKNATTNNDYFADARLQRETANSRAIETLNNLIKNPDTGKVAKDSAQKQILAYADAQKNEVSCENIIKAKGFSDCVVFINSANVTVVVKSQKLSDSDAAKIQQIITSQVKIDGKNVKIVEVA
jgi:stage III sporulation protein AH